MAKTQKHRPNRMNSSESPPPPPASTDNRQAEEQERETFTYAMQLASASVLPLALKTAIDLGIFDILAAADVLTAAEIAERIPTGNPEAPAMLDRILRLLVSHRVVCCEMKANVDRRKYCLSTAGKYFARDETGVSLAPFLALTLDIVYSDSWSQLKDAILRGRSPFNRVHVAHLFDYSATDARFSQEVYNTAMFSHTSLVFKKMLQKYNGFESCKLVVDVGGGIGLALSLITSKYPSIKCINFDLPHVIQNAPPFPGVKHVEGDMFNSVPEGDIIILKWILHDWHDEHWVELLKNCYRALPADGKVVVVEQNFPVFPESSFCPRQDKSQIDMLSLTQSSGEKERKQHEILELANSAGFPCIITFASYVYHYWVLEFSKKPLEMHLML